MLQYLYLQCSGGGVLNTLRSSTVTFHFMHLKYLNSKVISTIWVAILWFINFELTKLIFLYPYWNTIMKPTCLQNVNIFLRPDAYSFCSWFYNTIVLFEVWKRMIPWMVLPPMSFSTMSLAHHGKYPIGQWLLAMSRTPQQIHSLSYLLTLSRCCIVLVKVVSSPK